MAWACMMLRLRAQGGASPGGRLRAAQPWAQSQSWGGPLTAPLRTHLCPPPCGRVPGPLSTACGGADLLPVAGGTEPGRTPRRANKASGATRPQPAILSRPQQTTQTTANAPAVFYNHAPLQHLSAAGWRAYGASFPSGFSPAAPRSPRILGSKVCQQPLGGGRVGLRAEPKQTLTAAGSWGAGAPR